MRAPGIVVAAALLLAGCEQALTVKVLRYDVDANKPSRDKYAEARRTIRPARKALEQVTAAQLAVRRYKGCLSVLNVFVQELFRGIPPEARSAAKTKKQVTIDRVFQPMEAALASMQAELLKVPPEDPAPQFQELPIRFSELTAQLEQAKVETDPVTVRKAVRQFKGLESMELAQRGAAAEKDLEKLLADRSITCAPADVSAYLAGAVSGTPRAGVSRDPFAAEVAKASVRAAAELERARTGDLVPRPYGVWQDLTDPYLMFVVAHPEQWLVLVDSTNVTGQGDAEYVLVFESPLDPRLKTVTVDPSQVIQARLSIARKVAQAAVAATGIATTSFGVPLPALASATAGPLGEGVAPTDTIDYSRMTADEQLARERIAAERRRIERLKADAARLQPVKDVESARRALEFLRRELKTPESEFDAPDPQLLTSAST